MWLLKRQATRVRVEHAHTVGCYRSVCVYQCSVKTINGSMWREMRIGECLPSADGGTAAAAAGVDAPHPIAPELYEGV